MKSFYKKIVISNNNSSIILHFSNVSIEQNHSSFTITQEDMIPPYKFTFSNNEYTWMPET